MGLHDWQCQKVFDSHNWSNKFMYCRMFCSKSKLIIIQMILFSRFSTLDTIQTSVREVKHRPLRIVIEWDTNYNTYPLRDIEISYTGTLNTIFLIITRHSSKGGRKPYEHVRENLRVQFAMVTNIVREHFWMLGIIVVIHTSYNVPLFTDIFDVRDYCRYSYVIQRSIVREHFWMLGIIVVIHTSYNVPVRRRSAVVKRVEHISIIVLVSIWVAQVRVPLVLSVGIWICKNSTINA